jgi:putative protease
VEHVSHRPYATGFFYGEPGQYTANGRYIRDWQICAVVDSCDENGNAVLSLRNKFRAGDTVEIVGPDCKPFSFTVPEMEDMEGNPLSEPRTPQSLFRMRLPQQVPAMSFVRHAVELSAQD